MKYWGWPAPDYGEVSDSAVSPVVQTYFELVAFSFALPPDLGTWHETHLKPEGWEASVEKAPSAVFVEKWIWIFAVTWL